MPNGKVESHALYPPKHLATEFLMPHQTNPNLPPACSAPLERPPEAL